METTVETYGKTTTEPRRGSTTITTGETCGNKVRNPWKPQAKPMIKQPPNLEEVQQQ
jgi:hypothetical protein